MAYNGIQQIVQRIQAIEARIDSITGAGTRSLLTGNTGAAGFRGVLSSFGDKPLPETQWDSLILEASAKYGVDPGLVKSMMMAESSGNPNALSSAGAMGLMQLMPATAESLGITNPWDPAQNIMGGTRYLRGLLDRFGDPELAVAAYNAGPGAVRKFNGVPPYPETQGYVARVMSNWKVGEF